MYLLRRELTDCDLEIIRIGMANTRIIYTQITLLNAGYFYNISLTNLYRRLRDVACTINPVNNSFHIIVIDSVNVASCKAETTGYR